MNIMHVSKKQKHAYYIFIVLLYFFLLRDFLEQKVSVFGYIDDLIAAFAIIVFLLKISGIKGVRPLKRKDNYWLGIYIMIISGLLGNIIYHYQPFLKAALPDLFLCIKFWLWIEVGRYLYRGFDINSYAKRVFKHVKIITWLYFGLTLLDNVVHIFPADIRHGFRSTTLFYFHPTSFAACVILLMSILILIRSSIEKKRFYFYEIVLSVLAITSWRSKIIGSVLLFWLIVYLVLIRKRKVTVWTMLLFVPPVLLVGWDQIQYYFMSDMIQGSPRYQLLTKSFLIARDHLPIGAGFSTFGSHYSGVYYSPLYYIYGISNVYGITATNINYISDSFWPMIIGETGLIGTIGYFLAVYRLFRNLQMTRKSNIMSYATGLFVISYLLIESTSSAAFTNPVYMPIAFILSYVLNYVGKPLNRLTEEQI